MEISTILIVALSILIVMALVVFSIELFIPIHMQFEMNGICRSYIFEIEAEGTLPEYLERKLVTQLETIGLVAVAVQVDADGLKYGDLLEVVIQGDYVSKSMVNLFNRNNDVLVLKYERTLYVRKILN